MSRAALRSIALIGCILVAGCASNEIEPFDKDPVVREIASAAASEEPLGLRLAVSPIWSHVDRDRVNKEGSNRYSVDVDLRKMRADFVQMLGQYGIFEEVGTVDGESISECIDNAYREHYDLVMELNLKRFDVNYEGVNGWYAPNLINFALFIWTAWWVADEIYGANIEMEMALWSAHSGQQIVADEPFEEKQTRELNDFERGWKLTGSIFIPGGLKPENWQKIHEVVMPFALKEVKKKILAYMHNNMRAYVNNPEEDFAARMAKRLSIVVGVERHEDFLIHNLRYADDDALAFTEFLTDPYRADVPSKNVQTFVNHTATLKNVREAFGTVTNYCREDDTVIIYFAGYGAVLKDDSAAGDGYRKYVIMADTSVDDLASTALSLEELDTFCEQLPARNVLIVLDTSFSQPGETRSFVDIRKPPEEITLSEDFLKGLTDGRPGRTVVAACTSDQGALMLDEEQHGLLTHFLLEGTQPGQIPSDEPVLTLQDLLDYAIPAVEDRADIEGQPQTPMVLRGEGAQDIEMVFLGRGEAPEKEAIPEEEEMPEEEEGPEDLPGGGQ